MKHLDFKTLLMLIVLLPGLVPILQVKVGAQQSYPSVNELPVMESLPDPFKFFDSDRKVKTREDWEERQAEMLEMTLHYIYGPAFPQVNNYKVESRTQEPMKDGNAIKYTANLKMGRELNFPVAFEYYLLTNVDSHSVLVFCIGSEDHIPEGLDAARVIRRGYGFCIFKMGPSEKMARGSFPDVKGSRNMGWVWGLNEFINYLAKEHDIDNLIVSGCSRYGRVATIVGAMNEQVDLTAPVTTLAHAVNRFDESRNGPGNGKWTSEVYDSFAGKMNRLPVDRHFLGAVIAPRAYLGIMGAEKPNFNQGHVESYDALVPVYEWLGVRDRLGLYDHAPMGHGVNDDDLQTILDFADMLFHGKKLKNEDDFYKKNSGPVRYGEDDIDGTDGWSVPPPLIKGKEQ